MVFPCFSIFFKLILIDAFSSFDGKFQVLVQFWWKMLRSFGTVLMDTPKFWLSFPMFFNHFWMNFDWCILQFWWEIPSFGPVLVENAKKFWYRFDGHTQVLAQFSHVFQSFLNECWLMHSPVLMGNSKFWSSFGGKCQEVLVPSWWTHPSFGSVFPCFSIIFEWILIDAWLSFDGKFQVLVQFWWKIPEFCLVRCWSNNPGFDPVIMEKSKFGSSFDGKLQVLVQFLN